MFATGNIPYDDLQTMYGLVQCTRDTSLADYSQCLNSTISQIPWTCDNSQGCEITTGSCRVRFDTELFYGTPTAPTSSPPKPPSNSTASVQLRSAESAVYLYFMCSTSSSFSTNSTYQQSLKTVLFSLISNASKSGFTTATAGQSPDLAYGLALCRGDISPSDCTSCTSDAATELVNHCPNGKSAIIWYDNCLLRYSGHNFIGVVDTINEFYMCNTDYIWNPNLFKSLLGSLMNNLTSTATTDPPGRLYAAGHRKFNESTNLYGLAQCTRDISSSKCSNCLKDALSEIPTICEGKQGGRVVKASCSVRYELYLFFNDLGTAPPPANSPIGTPPSISNPASPESSMPNPIQYYCPPTSNFTTNSTYQRNRDALLRSFSSSSNASVSGFATATEGRSPDLVHGLVLCRGDVPEDNCMACISQAAFWIVQLCPKCKSAMVWYDYCHMRYSDVNFFGMVITDGFFTMPNQDNTLDVNLFNSLLGVLLDSLSSNATSDPSGRLFATGETRFNDRQKIYGLVQCTRDISAVACMNCLTTAVSEIPSCCDRKVGGWVVTASCNVRYEMYKFLYGLVGPQPSLEPVGASAPASPPASIALPPSNAAYGSGKSRTSTIIIVSVLVPSTLLLCLLTFFLFFKKAKRKSTTQGYGDEEIDSKIPLVFDLDIIRAATNNFSDANKLGEGGYGPVYKGQLSDGQEIAVKRLSRNSGQGTTEFKNEVKLVAKLQHRNLVRLLDPVRKTHLDWQIRSKIISGVARGLLYLHEDSRLKIIHRNLKAGNILLDQDMTAKISDFGMAKLVGVEETQGKTSKVAGTYGYMAPEYVMQGQFSVKSDVFSFGVLMLETVSGLKNSSFPHSQYGPSLLDYAWRLWRENRATELLDESLTHSSDGSEVARCIHIGLLCVQEDPTRRPTMSSIVLMLSSSSLTLRAPSAPAFILGRSRVYSDTSNTASTARTESDTSRRANHTTQGEFESKMHSVFNNLINGAHPLGFAKATAGEGSERVYGLVQCRGDVDQETCNACISTSTDQIVHPYCGTSLDAIICYEKCQLRYSNTDFFGRLNVENSRNSSTGPKADGPKALYDKLASLLKSNLTSEATREPSMIARNIESTCNGAEGCEIVTGINNPNIVVLVWVWTLWGENKALQVVDQILEGTCDDDEILRCIHIGLL
ncbi:Cysteine-rich receptor-like protein kinase 25 [Nymphaea thermarum]|nr:Cysteine-rich receptor-like protein kinase 25 [Nymphaea thermarum]